MWLRRSLDSAAPWSTWSSPTGLHDYATAPHSLPRLCPPLDHIVHLGTSLCLLIPARHRGCRCAPASRWMFAVGCVEGRDVHPDVTEGSVGANSPHRLPLCSRTAGIHHFQCKTSQPGTAEHLLAHICAAVM